MHKRCQLNECQQNKDRHTIGALFQNNWLCLKIISKLLSETFGNTKLSHWLISSGLIGAGLQPADYLWVYDEYSEDLFTKTAHSYTVCLNAVQWRCNRCRLCNTGLNGWWDEKVLPEVQYAANYAWNELSTFEANNKYLNRMEIGGQDFFKMFTYSLLQGNTTTALQSPVAIAISKKCRRFFWFTRRSHGRVIVPILVSEGL